MTPDQINETLRLHSMWLNDDKDGVRANLSEATLRGADLRCANLSFATLRGANLRCANLCFANLSEATMHGADLRGANLSFANLSISYLRRANLRGATLSETNLSGATLIETNLSGANLRGANLRGADLSGAYLRGANLPHFQICPQDGAFIAYKKVLGSVLTLEIPADARRTSSLVGRKCRAEFARVLSGSGTSERGGVYVEGEICHPDSYNDDIRIDCTHGVHFFMTRKEAEEW